MPVMRVRVCWQCTKHRTGSDEMGWRRTTSTELRHSVRMTYRE